MRVSILTQPLFRNYGGILQNYALQTVLKRLGHNPVTIDYIRIPNYGKWLLSCFKSIWLLVRTRHWRETPPFPKWWRPTAVKKFVADNINTTETVHSYYTGILKKAGAEAIIIGSDQVWRPVYNKGTLNNMFLDFAQTVNIPKLAYAASFGVDKWEYNEQQTAECKKLVQQFKAVSVREQSGIALCKQYFEKEAVWVLDPTLLLEKEDYESLIQASQPNTSKKPYLACYILNLNADEKAFAKKIAANKKLEVKFITAEQDMSLSIEEWLAIFHNADFVMTDSFHGTVFSILFQKDFFTIVNEARGASRFHSLLGALGLSDRIVTDCKKDVAITSIDYTNVLIVLNKKREESLCFLSNNIK